MATQEPVHRLSETPDDFSMRAAPRDKRLSNRSFAAGIAPWCAGYALIFVAILIARFDIVASPPYYDVGMGLWAEASFLVDTHFDFYRLRYEERLGIHPEGGRRNYLISLLPGSLALLMIAFSNVRTVLIVYHSFVFACAALVALLLFAMLRREIGRTSAILVAAAAMTTPVFCTQIDMAGMELPLAAGAMLTAWCLWRERYALAAAAAMLTFLMKPSGAIVTIAAVCFLILVGIAAWTHGDRIKATRAVRGALACLATLAGQSLLIVWAATFENYNRPDFGSYVFLVRYWVPDLAVIFTVCAALGLVLAHYHVRQARRAHHDDRWLLAAWHSLTKAVANRPLPWFAAIVVVGVLLASHVVFFIPRYFALGVPFFYLAAGTWLFSAPRARPLGAVALGGVIALNLANWNGSLYMSHQEASQRLYGHGARYLEREPSYYERSHEYLAEHRENVAAMKYLEQLAGAAPIVAGHPYNYYLTLPRLGYVSRPLRGYSITGYANAPEHFRDVSELLDEPGDDLILVWVANGYCSTFSKMRIPLPTAADEVLFPGALASPLIVYRKQFPPHGPGAGDWFETYFWHSKTPLQRAAAFARMGRLDNAVAAIRRHQLDVVDLRQMAVIAGLLVVGGGHEGAGHEFVRGIHYLNEIQPHADLAVDVMIGNETTQLRSPGEPISAADRTDDRNDQGLFAAALACLDREDLQGAARHMERLVRAQVPDVDAAVANYLTGVVDFRSGRYAAAAENFVTAIEHRNDLARAHFHHGLILEEQGHRGKALDQLHVARRLAPDNAETYDGLGVILARTGDFEAAMRYFSEALRLDSDFHAARMHLEGVRRRLARQADQTGRLAGNELID